MSFIDTFKEVFNLAPPSPTTKLITINSAVDYAELPRGFFRVETASGRETLGYKGPSFLSWEVGETVVGRGKTHYPRPTPHGASDCAPRLPPRRCPCSSGRRAQCYRHGLA